MDTSAGHRARRCTNTDIKAIGTLTTGTLLETKPRLVVQSQFSEIFGFASLATTFSGQVRGKSEGWVVLPVRCCGRQCWCISTCVRPSGQGTGLSERFEISLVTSTRAEGRSAISAERAIIGGRWWLEERRRLWLEMRAELNRRPAWSPPFPSFPSFRWI